MSDTPQLIKEKLDLLEYLKPIISLRSAGKNWKGLCPFHKEKTPSFHVSPERQIWHCFGGCNTGGDIFSFVMKYENIEFYEALKILAEKAGVDLKKSGSGEWQTFNRLYEANAAAKDFFKENLTPEILTYLTDRGLKKETIEEFELGFAPSATQGSFDNLLRYLTKKGFRVEDIEKAGLVFRTDRGTYWDRFRERIMFPIFNQFGKTIGFTGRVFGEEGERLVKEGRTGKYVNSPESPIFQKSKFLYGFHKSKDAIREGRLAVLVEGQMDFLMSWQDGLKNAVATSGTALTNDQLVLLKRVADQLVLSFDSDVAGQNAIERSIDLVAAEDFGVKVLLIPKGKDPADLVRAEPGAMIRLAETAQPAMIYYFGRYLGQGSSRSQLVQPSDFFQKKNNLRAVLSKIKNIASVVEQSFWLKELAAKTAVEEKILQEEMNRVLGKQVSGGRVLNKQTDDKSNQSENIKPLRKHLIAQRIFGLIYHNNEFAKIIQPLKEFFPATAHELFDYFQGIKLSSEKGQLAVSPTLEQPLNLISLQSDGSEEELRELIRQLKLEFFKHRQKQFQAVIQKSDQVGNSPAFQTAMKDFDSMSKELHNVLISSYEKEKTIPQNKTPLSGAEEKIKEDDWF